MIRLHRRVRFAAAAGLPLGPNGFAGSPAASGLVRHDEMVLTCRGEPDPIAGYLIDIKAIDRAVRGTLLPAVASAFAGNPADASPARILLDQIAPLSAALGGMLESIRWYLTPYHSLEVCMDRPATALLRQRFDFAASHRLYVPGLSDEENSRLFGKCSRRNGHGHNYQFEPCVEVAIDPEGRQSLSLPVLEAIADRTIIERFDHTHLNLDTTEFAQPGGVNPSVENIAAVFFRILGDAIRLEHAGATLRSVTVWETDRTSATYPA